MSMGGAGGLGQRLRAARPRLLRGALHALLLAAVALFFLNFNLVGTASPSKRYSQDLVYAWFGDEEWLYPRPRAPAQGAPAPPHVVVVMIDEKALALRGARWPVPVQFHAQLLAELEVLRPRGILLDFLLIDPAPQQDICDLLGIASRLNAEGIRLYLAVTRQEDLATLKAAACRDPGGELVPVERVFIPVSVQRQADDSDFVSRHYPFEQAADSNHRHGTAITSAAVRMYCDATPAPAGCVTGLTRGMPAGAGFELAWSPAGDPFNQRWTQAPCVEALSPVQAVLNKPALPRESRCPPVSTLFASVLLDPAEDPTLGPDALFALTDGAFLMVGGNFRGSADLVTTPLHTLLPGVYYHAAALQNLLAFDGRPKVRKEYRTPKIAFYSYDLLVLWLLAAIFLWRQQWLYGVRPLGLSPFEISPAARSWIAPFFARFPTPVWILAATVLLLLMAAYRDLQLIAVAALIVTVIIIELRVARGGEIRERLRGLLLYLAAMSLSLAVIVGAVWVGYRWLRLPPGDWLGYFSFAAFGFFLAHTAILEFGRRIDELYVARTAGGHPT